MSQTLSATLMFGAALATAVNARRIGPEPATVLAARPSPTANPDAGGDPPARVSAACARGKHNRCHGTVYVWPPNKDQRFADCQCTDPSCWHYHKERPLPHH